MFRHLSVAFFVSLAACSAAPVDAQSTDSTQDELKKNYSGPKCTSTDDCSTAFENGHWHLPSRAVDTCIANHDQPYYCMACLKSGYCSFHPGF